MFSSKLLPLPNAEALDTEFLLQLREDAVDIAMANGVAKRQKALSRTSDTLDVCPITLFPARVDRKALRQLIEMQPAIGLLYARASQNWTFIERCLASIIHTDELLNRLYNLWLETRENSPSQLSLIIQRSDYMLHEENGIVKAKQVEVNNFASGAAALAMKTLRVHKHILRHVWDGHSQDEVQSSLRHYELYDDNASLNVVVQGLVVAWKHANPCNGHIVIVVEDESLNIMDQRLTELALLEATENNARVCRLTLTQCYKCLYLNENKQLRFRTTDAIVTVVYYRTGYKINLYTHEHDWEARRMMELSTAVKCPPLVAQLVNTKRVQQVLSNCGEIESLLQSDFPHDKLQTVAEELRELMAPMHSLCDYLNADGTINISAPQIQSALQNPANWLLKTQGEGGGSTIWNNEMIDVLYNKSKRDIDLIGCILMQKLKPPSEKRALITRDEKLTIADCTSELGIFGHILYESRGKNVVQNRGGGYLLRTKLTTSNEGGIMSNSCWVDSCACVD